MIINLYSICDNVSNVFYAPVALQNDGVARRYFFDLLKSDKGILGQHPEDFFLCFVGKFDNHSGLLVDCVDNSNLHIIAKGDGETLDTNK